MEWWHKIMNPVERLWIGVAKRIGIRKTGLVKLHHDVRTCEYEDVQVLWEMLKKNETELAGTRTKKRYFWNVSELAKCTPFLCRSF